PRERELVEHPAVHGLPRLWEAQVDLRGGRVRPARGDDLAAGVEVDPLRAVDVRVAEEGVLPAVERVVRDRHRDRDVDADHPGLRLELELARAPSIESEGRLSAPARYLFREAHRFV